MTSVFDQLEPFYQYATCMNKMQSAIVDFLNQQKIDGNIVSNLQLLSIALINVDDDDFIEIKININLINSYLALLANKIFLTENDLQLLVLIFFSINLILDLVLVPKYNELATTLGNELTYNQSKYVLTGIVLNSYKTSFVSESSKFETDYFNDISTKEKLFEKIKLLPKLI